MRYPFMAAVNIFMDSYQGVYSQGMAAELRHYSIHIPIAEVEQ